MQPPVDVACELVLEVDGPAELALQVSAAGVRGGLEVEQDGEPVPWREVTTDAGGCSQLLSVTAGRTVVRYAAHVGGRAGPTPGVHDLDRLVMLRPSRYCPSDRLASVVGDVLRGASLGPWESALRLAGWVAGRTTYVPGSSVGTDDALDTLLAGQGVCRDFAHLVVALCRAADVPARLVSVYAPGLSPMDFHAVVEVAVDGRWRVLDATGLAPRASLVRIATGRDAADTAFLSSTGAGVALVEMSVLAVTTGPLPVDEGEPVHLA